MQTNKSQDVTNQEYQDLMFMFEQMRAQGLNPRVCDTPVPYRMWHPTRRGGQVEHREGVDDGVLAPALPPRGEVLEVTMNPSQVFDL